MGSLNERIQRLERDSEAVEDVNPYTLPLPRELVFVLDVLADLKRERLWDETTPIGEIERMLVDHGVEEPLAREASDMLRQLQEEEERTAPRWD